MAMQYFLKRGLAEFDDVFHNALGCIAGWLMVKGSRFTVKSQILVNG